VPPAAADPAALHRAAIAVRTLGHETVRAAAGGAIGGWDGPARAAYDGLVSTRQVALRRLGAGLEELAGAYDGAARLAGTPLPVRPGVAEGDGAGAPSADVRLLQRALGERGHVCGCTGADGVFGPATRLAVESLQGGLGLPVTGRADPATLLALGPGSPAQPPDEVRPALPSGPAARPLIVAAQARGPLRWHPSAVRAEASALVAAAERCAGAGRHLSDLAALPVPAARAAAVGASLGLATGAVAALAGALAADARRLRGAADGQADAERAVLAALAAAATAAAATAAAAPGGAAAPRGVQLAAWARRYVGTPYVWGGATPAGFDCSGLTSWVYAHAGVQLPRTSQLQSAAYPTFTAPAELRPGDLVFFDGSPGSAGHVALYLGGGEVLHAPSAGETVRVQALWGPWFAAHVRPGGLAVTAGDR